MYIYIYMYIYMYEYINIYIYISSICFGQICASARNRVQLRARRQKQSPYGPKGKSVAVAVEWQHVVFPKGKSQYGSLAILLLFFMQRVHCGCIYRSKGYQVFVTCVCVIMGCVWIIVCIWLSTCCLIVSS